MTVAGTEWVEVDCPDCGNVNREARRRCKRGGMCKGTGKVMKSVPSGYDSEAEREADIINKTGA